LIERKFAIIAALQQLLDFLISWKVLCKCSFYSHGFKSISSYVFFKKFTFHGWLRTTISF